MRGGSVAEANVSVAAYADVAGDAVASEDRLAVADVAAYA